MVHLLRMLLGCSFSFSAAQCEQIGASQKRFTFYCKIAAGL